MREKMGDSCGEMEEFIELLSQDWRNPSGAARAVILHLLVFGHVNICWKFKGLPFIWAFLLLKGGPEFHEFKSYIVQLLELFVRKKNA